MTTPEREKREPTWITCRCGAQWTARNLAHCGKCHQSFSGPSTFDLHRSTSGEHGSCRSPVDITNSVGERVLFLRGGVWRGPELTDEEKTARFGDRYTQTDGDTSGGGQPRADDSATADEE